MGRDPTGYQIWSSVIQAGNAEYRVMVRATAVDLSGPAASFNETATFPTPEEARAAQLKMTAELADRLARQGHTILDVNSDFF